MSYMDNIPLNKRQKDFCIYYVETGNATEAYRRAGYKADNMNTLTACPNQLLRNPRIQAEIKRLNKPLIDEQNKHIATSQEVMEFFTKMMNGEIKDQFGLDATNADRIKAAQEIAKRTVDIDNRTSGTPDNLVHIKLDWRRDNGNSKKSEDTDDGK